jgi:hypothetical protein
MNAIGNGTTEEGGASMTNHKINVAIAETCGWTEFHTEDFTEMGVPCFVQMALPPRFIHIENSMPLPDYCKDLNAMHEAEMIFTPESKHWMYYALLDDMCGSSFKAIRATARQRAEAFLRTLGKWEEVQP